MKKKLRRQLKDYYQIGNYIYANREGTICVVIPRGELLKDNKISADFNYLFTTHGVDSAYSYLSYIHNYLKK